MKNQLETQLEEILDEGEGNLRSIIVQMNNPKSEIADFINLAGQAVNRRGMLNSARDLLPPSYEEMKAKLRRPARKQARSKSLGVGVKSISSIAMELFNPTTTDTLKNEAIELLTPLMDSSFMKDSRSKLAAKKQSITQFWASASVAFEIDKDDLAQIVKQVPNIGAIFPNRDVSVPPISKVNPNQLPKSVTENKTSAWGIDAIGAMSVWGAYNARGKGIKVAVLDTGIDSKHPDLQGKISPADWAVFDRFGNITSGARIRDSASHGTHCSGTIAGGDNSGKWIGVAPEASLAAGMVLPNGGGTDAQILAGMQWAINKGVDVISMSLGGFTPGQEVYDTYSRMIISANQLGIPVVVAIGNEGNQTSGPPGNDYFAFTIGATNPNDISAGFSGGRTQVIKKSRFINPKHLPLIYQKPDLCAPGVAITSSVPGRNRYDTWNGTSMATPHVAGALALLLSATDIKTKVVPSQRALLLQDLILGTVEELGESGQDQRYGMGRLNVLKAVGMAKERGY